MSRLTLFGVSFHASYGLINYFCNFSRVFSAGVEMIG